jgi:hypothetical protein
MLVKLSRLRFCNKKEINERFTGELLIAAGDGSMFRLFIADHPVKRRVVELLWPARYRGITPQGVNFHLIY